MAVSAVPPIPPITTLARLRTEVLARSTTRPPKWGFRLATDLVLQLQPKPVYFYSDADRGRLRQFGVNPRQETARFDGRAFLAIDGRAPETAFITPATRWEAPWAELKFALVAYQDALEWALETRGGRWSDRKFHWAEIKATLLGRLHNALTDGRFDHFSPELMLRPACMICGRPLTDPASMARWIGPECAGTSALTMPGLVSAEGAA